MYLFLRDCYNFFHCPYNQPEDIIPIFYLYTWHVYATDAVDNFNLHGQNDLHLLVMLSKKSVVCSSPCSSDSKKISMTDYEN